VEEDGARKIRGGGGTKIVFAFWGGFAGAGSSRTGSSLCVCAWVCMCMRVFVCVTDRQTDR